MSANPIKFFRCPQALYRNFIPMALSLKGESGVPCDCENPEQKITIPGSQEILPLALGALAGLTLGGIFWTRQLYSGLVSLGQGSEEIFRGQQLPLLKFPRREG